MMVDREMIVTANQDIPEVSGQVTGTIRPPRKQLIESIEQERHSSVISYITNTRQNLSVAMAMDTIRVVYEHLRAISPEGEKVKKIDLFIHSDGGDGTVPWRLVTLIREYAEHFAVLVPHRAFSAATLTALGADEILMHPMGMLGPTDPTVTNEFNPPQIGNPAQKIGISVEDVSAYLSLVRDDANIHHEDEVIQAFSILANQVHPLALGNVKRSQLQSRMMAKKLLSLHMTKAEEHGISEIAENLSSKLYFHGHPINRTEARIELGLKVMDADLALEQSMWNLYLEYEREMQMDIPFDLLNVFLAARANQSAHIAATPISPPVPIPPSSPSWDTVVLPVQKLVYIESSLRADVRSTEYTVSGLEQIPNNFQFNIRTDERWSQER
jgi:hypothetical protein